jgi:hypothetical protein
VDVQAGKVIKVQLSGKSSQQLTLQAKDSNLDIDALIKFLQEQKTQP